MTVRPPSLDESLGTREEKHQIRDKSTNVNQESKESADEGLTAGQERGGEQ